MLLLKHLELLYQVLINEYFESIEQKLVAIELLYLRTYLVDDLMLALYHYEYRIRMRDILRKYKPNLSEK